MLRLVGLSSFLRAGDKIIKENQKRIFGLLILCVALVLSLKIGTRPRIKSNGLVIAQCGIKRINDGSLDMMPDVKSLPFEFSNLPMGLIKQEAVRTLPRQFIPKHTDKTSKSGSSESGFPPDGEMIINQPPNHGAKGGPKNNLKWGYCHFFLSGIVSFTIGYFARELLPNVKNNRPPKPKGQSLLYLKSKLRHGL